MRKMVIAFAAVCAAALAFGTRTEAARCVRPPVVPDALKVPGIHAPQLRLPATGVQIYTCTLDATGAYVWKFKAPEATLFSESGRRVGDHFGGPTWRLRDGSKVVGQLLAKADAPEAGAVPWLLLAIADNSGRGALADARFIQRVHTSGGVAPADGCDASTVGEDARVDYTADYYFW